MKVYLAPLLCALSAAACASNKSADMPPESARNEAVPPLVASSSDTTTPVSNNAGASVDTAQTRSGTDTTTPASATSSPGAPAAPTATDYKTMDASAAPDNSKVNKRDAKGSTPTPIDQGESQTDLDITKKIRQAVMGDSTLSFSAKNVKIITRDGKVTLRGPVSTNQERSAIQAAAQKVAGASNVDNQLEVKK